MMEDDHSAARGKDERDALRERMVLKQIEARGVRDPRVLAALRAVPRHRFVPTSLIDQAYDDRPLAIGYGQTISQPYMVGFMTELLRLRATDRVLEIGTGSGYQAAILGLLAGEVFTVERIPELAESARLILSDLGYTNVHVFQGDGTLGLREYAPYDAIMVTAGAPRVPTRLCDQLAESGRLVCPVGGRDLQHLVRVTRHGDAFEEETGIGCVFVPLVGAEGWSS